MLKPVVIALTMMGCDCDGRLCVAIDAPERTFASVAECEAALASAIESETGRLYPLLKAQCERTADEVLVADASGRVVPDTETQDATGVVGQGFAYAGRAGEYILYGTTDGVVAVRDGLGWAVGRLYGGASWAIAALAR